MGVLSRQLGERSEGRNMLLRSTPIWAIRRSRMPYLKALFWIYFLLLVFEGSLRKWVAPGLSAPLLLVRDPVAILILIEAHLGNKWPARWTAATGFLAAGLIGLCLIQMLSIDNPLIAALYGLRSYLLPFPVAFIMGENLDAEDLRKFGVCMLWLLLPLTLLEVAQYLAAPGSFLNVGAYRGAEQIAYVGAHMRASGTFSFVIGPIYYNTIAAAFIFYGFATEGFAKKWLLWAAACALLLSVPVIGARTLVYTLAMVVGCAGIAAMSGVTQFGKSLRIAVPALIVSLLLSLLPVFSEASSSLRLRFRLAGQAEGGTTQHVVEERVFDPILNRLENAEYFDKPFGLGVGQGAPAVGRLLRGRVSFVEWENEIDRVVLELGALPGLAFMLFRFILTVMLGAAAIARARGDLEPLALLLAPAVITTLFLGVLEQPTETGFMVISVAFALAALKRTRAMVQSVPARSRLSLPARYSSLSR